MGIVVVAKSGVFCVPPLIAGPHAHTIMETEGGRARPIPARPFRGLAKRLPSSSPDRSSRPVAVRPTGVRTTP